MESGLSAVQAILGSSTVITDKEIKDALWDFYFDVEQTVDSLVEEQHRRSAAEQRKQGKFRFFSSLLSSSTMPPILSCPRLGVYCPAADLPKDPPAPPMSKLAALAAARKAATAHRVPSKAVPASAASTPAPTLSKLQQRAQSGSGLFKRAAPAEPEPVTVSLPETALFHKTVAKPPPTLAARPSGFAGILATDLHRPAPTIFPDMSNLMQSLPLAGPSPDDIALQARTGTRFGPPKP
jgi:elongation factor 1 alpha-like protein